VDCHLQVIASASACTGTGIGTVFHLFSIVDVVVIIIVIVIIIAIVIVVPKRIRVDHAIVVATVSAVTTAKVRCGATAQRGIHGCTHRHVHEHTPILFQRTRPAVTLCNRTHALMKVTTTLVAWV
jgi:hypothetical protein